MKVKVAQLCLTLCDPMDCTVCGILQARILEWVVFPSPEDLPNPGIEPKSPALRRGSLPAEPQGKPEISLRNFHYNPLTLLAQQVKNLPAVQETKEMRVWSLNQEDPLEEEMAAHSSILAWKIPWTEEPGRLQSMGLQRVRRDWAWA